MDINRLTQRKYGLDWPKDMHPIFIDLVLAKHWRREPYKYGNLLDPREHMLRAATELFDKSDFKVNKWTEEHAEDFTKCDFCITWGCAASGKAQPLDAEVQTPSGPRKMGDIQVGDEVLNADGGCSKVTKIHNVGMQRIYRVHFRDGALVDCAGTHLWEVQERRPGAMPKLMSTVDLLPKVTRFPGRYSIPIGHPAAYPHRALPMNPYLLGALLGDGSLGGTSGEQNLRFSCTDADILDHMREGLDPAYHLRPVSRGPDYTLVRRHPAGRTSNRYICTFKTMGLWGKKSVDKFIPKVFLTASEQDRRELLAGLLDTDGTVGKLGNVTFTSVSRQLAEDVRTLVWSLGGLASMGQRHTGYKDKRTGQTIICSNAYTVGIRFPDRSIPLFHCARKQARIRLEKPGTDRRCMVWIDDTKIFVPMKCITTDHPRGLYLTNGFAATHNSNDYGLFTLLDWIVDPMETLSILASTTAEMLQFRSFEAVLRYYRRLKRHPQFLIPGKESRTRLAIVNAEDPDMEAPDGAVVTVKASIKGVAVHAGTVEEARANLQGAHLPYTRLILDELSQMKEAAMQARHNMSIGVKDFRLFGLCNPDSLFDLACRHSEPLGGWGSVDPETDTVWDTRWGRVRRHDGLKSPGLTQPEEFPYTLKQDEVDRIAREAGGNTDTTEMWTMVRGWPPPQGNEQTILTESMLTTFHMRDPVIWGKAPMEPIQIVGVDPAFTSGGDKAMLQPAQIGYEAGTGLLVIAFGESEIIPIRATSTRPAVYQVVDYVLDWADEHDFDLQYLGIDESGTQRVGDMVEVEGIRRFQRPISLCRVNFGASATEFPVSVRKDTPARKEYGNQVTELWYSMQEFGCHNQIRGLPLAAAEQFCRRRVLPKRPRSLESKDLMKKRIKRSPDDADACACALAVARWVLQIVPGASLMRPSGDNTSKKGVISIDMCRMFDLCSPDRMYKDAPI